MRGLAIGLAAAVTAASCGEQSAGEYVGLGQSGADFDCAIGFDALVEQIMARPGATDWGREDQKSRLIQDGGEPRFYIVTNSSHPAHPAIIHRMTVAHSEGVGFTTQACAYGDRDALDKDLAAYAALDDALAAEFDCYLCNERKTSPSLERNWDIPNSP